MAKDKNGKELPQGFCQRSDGRYMAKATINGERISVIGHSIKEVQKKINDRIYESQHGLYVKETNIKVADWFNTWLNEYKLNSVKYGTIVFYQETFDNYVRDKIGRFKLTDIRPEHIQAIYNDLVKSHYSQSTIEGVSALLSGMFKQAYKNQLIKRNPVELATVPKLKEAQKDIRAMSRSEQKIFLEYARDNSLYYNEIRVGLGTGVRSGELRALEWKDIDFKNKEIHITGTLKFRKGAGYFKDTPKTKSSIRTIPMLDRVSEVLKEQRKEQAELRLSVGEKWKPEKGLEDLVFTSPSHRKGYGRPVTSTALNNDLKAIVDMINEDGIEFEDISPHTLRHTFATRGLENGIPPKVMQVLLGHSSIQITLDTYSHVLSDMKVDEIQKIADII